MSQCGPTAAGIYMVPFLQPATYTVTAKRNGFEPAGQTNIMLHIRPEVTPIWPTAPQITSDIIQSRQYLGKLRKGLRA